MYKATSIHTLCALLATYNTVGLTLTDLRNRAAVVREIETRRQGGK